MQNILPTKRHVGVIALTLSAFALGGCGLTQSAPSVQESQDRTIRMIVTESAPFQEPTEIAKELLAEQGWDLQPTYVTDIIQPNHVVSEGEYDANYFQHLSYLEQFNEDNDTKVEPAFSTFYMPNGFFSLEYDSLDQLPDNAEISLAVDTTNNGRGIKILADAGLIEVDESVPISGLSQDDIIANPHGFNFVEIDLQSTGQTLPDVDAAFAPTRLVAEAGYDIADTTLVLEESTTFKEPFTVVVGVRPGSQDSEKIQALQQAFQSEEVAAWFDDYLDGAIEYNYDITTENAQELWSEFTAE